MAERKTATQTAKSQFNHLQTLIEGVKSDALVQFGEIKKDFGGINSTLTNHEGRIKDLEKDKIERDAIAKYRSEHPELAQKVFDTGQKGYNDSNDSTIVVNKELLKAIGYLVVALGVIVAALAATKRI